MKKYKIYTYTIIRSAAQGFEDKTPYLIAILEDERGDRTTKMISGWTNDIKVAIGMDVEEQGSDINKKYYLINN